MKLLEGIKIIDFTRLLPGPLGTHILGQMGAEIIKIESPQRADYTRFAGAQIDGASTLFHQLNHNKTLLTLDYNSPQGKEQIYELVAQADVVIESFRPQAMEAWGLGYCSLKAINSSLIYASVVGYGQGSSHSLEAGHDLNYLAYSGVLDLQKDEQGKPVVSGVQWADGSGAYMLAIAVQGALLQRYRTGKGAYIEVALAASVAPFLAIPYSLHTANMPDEQSNIFNGKTFVNYAVYECADGKWLSFAAYELKFWNLFCDLTEKTHWKTNNLMDLQVEVFDKLALEAFFKTKKQADWVAFFAGNDVCIAPVLALENIENEDFHRQQGTFETFVTPNGTPLKTIALPFLVRE